MNIKLKLAEEFQDEVKIVRGKWEWGENSTLWRKCPDEIKINGGNM